MPLQDFMHLISVDDHLFEHGDVWQERLPATQRDAGPRMIEDDDGRLVWLYESKRDFAFKYMSTMAGKPPEEYTLEPGRPEEFRPGCLDPAERVKDMDIDGVQAQLCFPSYPRFAGTRFLFAKDKDLALNCVRAYNDFVLDEWCAVAPDRYISAVIVPLWDPALAVAEIGRTAAKGAKTISFPESTVPLDLPSVHTGHWDPVFAAAEAADLPLSMHIGTSGNPPKPSPETLDPTRMVLMACTSMGTVADWVFSDVFRKFPRLRIAVSEGGVGWIPYLKEKMDFVWERQRFWSGIDQEARPSEVIEQHVFGCFIDDIQGVRNRDAVGIKNLMWESDYPHADSPWPHSRKRVGELLSDVPDDEAHRIVELNARELYSFPREEST